jgi:hypothetical protein
MAIASPPDLPTLDQFSYHHRLEESQGIVLVLFSAPGCSSCRAWRRLLAGYTGPGVRSYLVDVEQDTALAREFEVFHLPALFLYLNGAFHGELQCEARAEALTQAIARAMAAPAREAP